MTRQPFFSARLRYGSVKVVASTSPDIIAAKRLRDPLLTLHSVILSRGRKPSSRWSAR